uniref:Uncharacterized protein n=1 Tax=Arundo donax TaxID=35708 RepID=A0A0A9B7F8_ARUDO
MTPTLFFIIQGQCLSDASTLPFLLSQPAVLFACHATVVSLQCGRLVAIFAPNREGDCNQEPRGGE